MSGFIDKKKRDSGEVRVEAVGLEITKFLEMLVNHVDLKVSNAVDLLRALQHSKAINKNYRKVVSNTVSFRIFVDNNVMIFCRLIRKA